MFDNQTEIIGIAGGICTSISLIPQLVRLIRKKSSEDLSVFYLLILEVGLGLWIWYGTLREDVPIIVTNSFAFLVNLCVIVLGMRYRKSKSIIE